MNKIIILISLLVSIGILYFLYVGYPKKEIKNIKSNVVELNNIENFQGTQDDLVEEVFIMTYDDNLDGGVDKTRFAKSNQGDGIFFIEKRVRYIQNGLPTTHGRKIFKIKKFNDNRIAILDYNNNVLKNMENNGQLKFNNIGTSNLDNLDDTMKFTIEFIDLDDDEINVGYNTKFNLYQDGNPVILDQSQQQHGLVVDSSSSEQPVMLFSNIDLIQELNITSRTTLGPTQSNTLPDNTTLTPTGNTTLSPNNATMNQTQSSYVSFSSNTRPVVRDLQIILNKDITNNIELKNKIIPLVNLLHGLTTTVPLQINNTTLSPFSNTNSDTTAQPLTTTGAPIYYTPSLEYLGFKTIESGDYNTTTNSSIDVPARAGKNIFLKFKITCDADSTLTITGSPIFWMYPGEINRWQGPFPNITIGRNPWPTSVPHKQRESILPSLQESEKTFTIRLFSGSNGPMDFKASLKNNGVEIASVNFSLNIRKTCKSDYGETQINGQAIGNNYQCRQEIPVCEGADISGPQHILGECVPAATTTSADPQ